MLAMLSGIGSSYIQMVVMFFELFSAVGNSAEVITVFTHVCFCRGNLSVFEVLSDVAL